MKLAAFIGEVSFFEVANAGDSGRFFDDYEEIVDMNDTYVGGFDRFRQGLAPEFYHVFCGDFTDGIQAKVSVDLNFTPADSFSNLAPTGSFQPLFQGAFENGALVGGVEVKELKRGFVLGAHAMLSVDSDWDWLTLWGDQTLQ